MAHQDVDKINKNIPALVVAALKIASEEAAVIWIVFPKFTASVNVNGPLEGKEKMLTPAGLTNVRAVGSPRIVKY